MKIVHCCLAAFYIDDYSYQENKFPKFHKMQGHDVSIIASTETYLESKKIGYLSPSTYHTKEGIRITRLPYTKMIPHLIVKKLRIYKGLENKLNEIKPDIIFLHDCQFLSILKIVKYAKNNKVKIFADCHTDFINSGNNWVSKNILHGIIYKYCIQKVVKYTTKFYGTLPLRVEFLKNVYNVPSEKISLLPFGVDDSLFEEENKIEIRKEIRDNLNLKERDFVIISGGKIDARKNIDKLIKAFLKINNENLIENFKFILFGKPVKELEEIISLVRKNTDVRYVEWLDSDEIHKYFLASDLAVFPGTHSVLWEEAVGLGLPCLFKKWKGIDHVDLGGNCLFIKEENIEELTVFLLELIRNKTTFTKLKKNAQKLGPRYFSYSEISKRAIE